MVPFLLVLLFIVVPIAEIAIIIQVGNAIGVWWTIALLIADAVIGSMLARTQGRAAWRRFTLAIESGRVPARETVDGILVLVGGALLLPRGFLSDTLALFLLAPPTPRRSSTGSRGSGSRPARTACREARSRSSSPGASRCPYSRAAGSERARTPAGSRLRSTG